MVYQLAENGLIHSDFNEYNLMVDESHKVIPFLTLGDYDRFPPNGVQLPPEREFLLPEGHPGPTHLFQQVTRVRGYGDRAESQAAKRCKRIL